MKTALLAACFLCATAAFGQSVGGSMGTPSMSAPFQMTNHEQHASFHQMGQEQTLFGTSGVYTAQGEVPLWEVAPPEAPTMPLGDVARLLRKERETAKKATFVYSQVGSE
jgi:hypothetical protein